MSHRLISAHPHAGLASGPLPGHRRDVRVRVCLHAGRGRPATLAELRAPDDYAVGRETLLIRDEADKARFGREFPLMRPSIGTKVLMAQSRIPTTTTPRMMATSDMLGWMLGEVRA